MNSLSCRELRHASAWLTEFHGSGYRIVLTLDFSLFRASHIQAIQLLHSSQLVALSTMSFQLMSMCWTSVMAVSFHVVRGRLRFSSSVYLRAVLSLPVWFPAVLWRETVIKDGNDWHTAVTGFVAISYLVNGQSPPPPVNRPPVRSPLVLVIPVKGLPRWNAICGQKPPYVKSPPRSKCFCLFSLGFCFVSICFLMCVCLPIPLCTFPYGFLALS